MYLKEADLFVVGIGASAGGLDAIQKFFHSMPSDTGMAFVIIQHLSPDFKSLMPELLAKHTSMPIYTAEDKQVVKENCIYLTQRNKNLHIKDDKLYLLDQGPKHNLNLPIDIFFHTLGEEYKEKSVGVILSGTGSDGSRGIKTIKESGGTVLVQEPETAQFNGMPNAAIGTNLVDYILGPTEMANVLVKIPSLRLVLTKSLIESDSNDIIFFALLDEIYKYSGIDFKQYKRNTLLRRIEKRLNLSNIDHLFDYLTFLKSNDKEKQLLKQDFLIGVTRFFRDAEAFESLKQHVIPSLFANYTNGETVRVWIVSCSTGEEAYSVAMLLDEYIHLHKLPNDFKIFATDVDANALQIASLGIYNANNTTELEKHYFDSYFLKSGDNIQIIKRIRDKIVFTNHNILKDAPFIKIDLITCRNILIYFNNTAQLKVLNNLLFSLNYAGYLFLGSSESMGDNGKNFTVVDAKNKIFKNISGNKPSPLYEISKADKLAIMADKPNLEILSRSEKNTREKSDIIYHRYLSQQYSPSCIFIDTDFNILFIKGDAGKYLSFNEGIFHTNLLKLISDEFGTILQIAIKRLDQQHTQIMIKDIIIKNANTSKEVQVILQKVFDFEGLQNVLLLYFTDEKKIATESIQFQSIPMDEFAKNRIADLELSLKETKYDLQNAIEELETSNEELQASNEELMASNEELQSTNEELQSVNEELFTVNYELQEKNKELTQLNNDYNNLFNTTDVGTLFLDVDLRIRKFTQALTIHFNLKEEDVGRPIGNFAANFNEAVRLEIIEDSKKVLTDFITLEVEIEDNDHKHYVRRIAPFITMDRKIDGVVITFVEITALKNAYKDLSIQEHQMELDANYYKSIIENNSFYVVKTDLEGNYTYLNDYFCKMFNIQAQDWIGKSAMGLIIPEDHNLCAEAVTKCFAEPEKSFWTILRKPSPKGIVHSQWEYKLLKNDKGEIFECLCLGHEITDLIKKQQDLQQLNDINVSQNNRLLQFTHIVSHNVRSHIANLKGIIKYANNKELGEKPWEMIKEITNALDDTIFNLNKIVNIQNTPNIDVQKINLSKSVEVVQNSLSHTILETKTNIIGNFSNEDYLYANDAYFDSILLNFISNAIKYKSLSRFPIIEINFKQDDDYSIVSIQDNGLGIDLLKYKDKLFGMYNTFHKNKDAKGLGLFISKIQVEAMNGKIEVESEVDRGTIFKIYLPNKKEGMYL